MSRLLFTLSLLFFMPIGAIASTINDEGAQKLATTFQDILDYQKDVNDIFGSVILSYDGKINVEQKDDHYTVTLPSISMKSPEIEDDDNDFKLDIGVITIDAKPSSDAGYWQTTWSIPSKITLSDNSDDNNLVITFGAQKINAVLNEALGYFTKMEFDLDEIIIKSGDEDLGIEIGGISSYLNLVEGEDGKFSGPAHALIKNLLIADPEENKSVEIGELKIDFNIDNFKLPPLKEYKEKILKHSEAFKSLSNIDEDQDENGNKKEINGSEITDMLFDLYKFDMDGVSFKYSLKDLNITSDEEDKNEDFTSLYLGYASFGMGFNGINSDKGSFSIGSEYNKINIQPADPEYSDIVPQNMLFNIMAVNIPYKTLGKISKTSAKSIAENPEAMQMVGLGLMMRLPAILSQAGTQIIIDNNGIKNDTYAITLDGNIKTDLTALAGFSAKFKTVFKGLDALLIIAKNNSLNSDSKNASSFAKMVETLEKMQEIGVKEDAHENAPYMFDFEATPEGTFLINGQDTKTIMAE